jgi:hypothetical protein
MENNFVPYEIAVALKELGFNEPCFTTYDNEGRLRNPFDYPKSEYADNLPYIEDTKEWIYNSDLNNPANFQAAHNPMLLKFFLDNPFTAAPLWQQAFDFFRKKYKLENSVYWANVYRDYRFSINNLNNPKKEGEKPEITNNVESLVLYFRTVFDKEVTKEQLQQVLEPTVEEDEEDLRLIYNRL